MVASSIAPKAVAVAEKATGSENNLGREPRLVLAMRHAVCSFRHLFAGRPRSVFLARIACQEATHLASFF
jgi:hypothetical protein